MTENWKDEYVKQMAEWSAKFGRDADKAVWLGRARPHAPPMPCQRCGGRLSVQMPDYYAGIESCDDCGAVASLDDLERWARDHAPSQAEIDAWEQGKPWPPSEP